MRTNGGKRGEVRSSALWGTGNRGGESRSSALWGRGGRGAITALVAMLVIGVPLASGAAPLKQARLSAHGATRTWISPGLLRRAKRHPSRYVRVIIQSTDGTMSPAVSAFARVNQVTDDDLDSLHRRLSLVDGVSATVRANQLDRLLRMPHLIVTPDVQVHVSSYSSAQLWPYETGLSKAWSGPDATPSSTAPTIAIVDSGIQPGRPDFGNRVLTSVKFSTLPDDSPGDGRGHGTFVAGIAAGGADNYTGGTPQAKLVSLDVMDDHGVARTSDVIAACQWILANKDAYNIRIANFSLHSTTPSHFFQDPLDRAVEQLWFNGVVVVAAAGNYGSPAGPSGVLYAPGNDPFVVTVGAVDIGGTKNAKDDTNAPWSAYGRTEDGFMKPELAAPGRYIVGPVPMGSTLSVERASNIVAPGYIQLSGTSFAAPVISAAAAQILARHPEVTPDQVKGALMVSTTPVDGAATGSVGVGELQMAKAASVTNPPNPNRALDQFVTSPGGSGKAFDAVSWADTATANVSWDSVSWTDVSWADVSWADSSDEDAAEVDRDGSPNGYALTPARAAEVLADPSTAPDLNNVPATVAGAAGG